MDPFAVDDELGDGAFADVAEEFLGGAGGSFDVNLCVGDAVMVEKALCFAAVATPAGRVNEQLHCM